MQLRWWRQSAQTFVAVCSVYINNCTFIEAPLRWFVSRYEIVERYRLNHATVEQLLVTTLYAQFPGNVRLILR